MASHSVAYNLLQVYNQKEETNNKNNQKEERNNNNNQKKKQTNNNNNQKEERNMFPSQFVLLVLLVAGAFCAWQDKGLDPKSDKHVARKLLLFVPKALLIFTFLATLVKACATEYKDLCTFDNESFKTCAEPVPVKNETTLDGLMRCISNNTECATPKVFDGMMKCIRPAISIILEEGQPPKTKDKF